MGCHTAKGARLDCHSYGTAILTVSDLWCGKAHFPWGLLMPFRTNYLRNKADEYRALAAAMTDGAIRLQLLNMAERYDREADQNDRQNQQRTEKVTPSR